MAKSQLLNIINDSETYPTSSEPIELPNWWALLHPVAKWLVLPTLLLGAALVALFFAEEQRPTWALVILAVTYGVILLNFGVAHLLESRHLLGNIAQSIPPILGCSAEQFDELVSPDRRVRYLQQVAYSARVAALEATDAEAAGVSDRLHFVRAEIAAHEASSDGHVILDAIGSIMWCNKALSQYFKYDHGSLLSENIRILIPHPYNAAHDSLIRKYDRECTVKKIVGCTRYVPVIDKEGQHSQVFLFVDERRDPTDETNNLFLGKMQWAKEPELCAALQQRVDEGVSPAQACETIKSDWDNFLLINPRGQILFASEGICQLLRWPRAELQTKNVSVLMNPEVAEGHTSLLERYIHRLEESQAAGAEPPASSTVGKGRDLYARCRTGEYVRTWVVVERIEAPSRKPADCCFLGMMIYIQGQDHRRGMQAKPSATPRISARGRAHRLAPNNNHRSPRESVVSSDSSSHQSSVIGVAKKRCTVVAFDFYGAPNLEMDVLAVEYQKFVSLLTAACLRNNAVLHAPLGDRIFVSLNLTVANPSQRSTAGLIMHQVLQGHAAAHPSSQVELRAAAVCGDAFCAVHNHQPVLISDAMDLCACMLAIAHEAQVKYGLIDPTLYEELQYAYECRMVNVVTLCPRQGSMRRVPLYEQYSVKELDENEWMYQIQAQHKKDPLAAWRECWDHLNGSSTVPEQLNSVGLAPQNKYDLPLACMAQHLALNPDVADRDGPAHWLRQILQHRQQMSSVPRTVQVFGKLRCLVHYHLDEKVDDPQSSSQPHER
eukprot:GGOE01007241.1.p1 GENE.GGOE01007241.1~~GGOE01007241.1.p1  ORF type:complete len:865 (-),score=173.50 GGOE01007241.1:1484-3814(-)